jgi:hypothetical protein
MIDIPATLVSESASTTAAMLTDFLTPITFVVGAIVLFIVVPRVISWVKKIGGGESKKKDRITYTYKEGRLSGGYKN